jgi:hypothetical protein
MSNYTVDLKAKNVGQYGELIIVRTEEEYHWIIPGRFEITKPIVHGMSKRIQLNKKDYTLIKLPNQREVQILLRGIVKECRTDKWFSDSTKSQSEFAKVESAIARAMHKFKLNDNSIIGLIGELTILYQMLVSCDATERTKTLAAWKGHSSTSRDFIFDGVCVEVKTTRKEKSTHYIHGLNQIDATDDDGGDTRLFLASIGLEEDDDGVSLSETVEKFSSLDLDKEKMKQLLEAIKSYGVNTIGYDHKLMKTWEQFNVKFMINFERYYDMSDSNIKLPKHSDFDDMTHLVTKTLMFFIDLPDEVTADVNPKDFSDFFLCIPIKNSSP